jgi:hypothetical protein
MPADEARSLIEMINERVRSSGLEPNHRDTLIRLMAILEDDLSDSTGDEEKVVENQPNVQAVGLQ